MSPNSARAVLPVVLACLLTLGACLVEDPSPTRSPSPAQTASGEAAVDFQDIPGIVDGVAPSVVSVLRVDGGEGSGVIWTEDGIIVTNNHVVADAPGVVVGFADGVRVDAEVIATDPRTDLAVLQAERDDLPAATLADGLPEIGELALAIGNPLGFENSVTMGIVSGLGRSIPGAAQQAPALVDLIQTDAAISPGNSGGALVDADGRVIGVNVAYLAPNPPGQRGAVSIGFAIPAPTVRSVVEQLLEDGRVEHPFLGVQPITLSAELAQQFGIDRDDGVVVLAVVDGSPAERAGLRPGDLLVALEDETLATAEDLLAALRGRSPGDTVSVTFIREGEETTVEVELGDVPQPAR